MQALILGVANHRSIAWNSAVSLLKTNRFENIVVTSLPSQAATVKRLADQAMSSAETSGIIHPLTCDVNCDESMSRLFGFDLPEILGSSKLDSVVHSLAYAPAEAMKGGSLLECSADDFRIAHHVSAYSLIDVARRSINLLNRPSSIVTLSYLGASKAIPNYNIMGPAKASLESIVRGLALELGKNQVHVNCVSAGPVNTIAARGINDFHIMRENVKNRSPLGRNVSSEEIADVIAFLSQPKLSSGISGQTIFVDAGYSIVS